MSPFVFGVFMTVLSLSAIAISTWLAGVGHATPPPDGCF